MNCLSKGEFITCADDGVATDPAYGEKLFFKSFPQDYSSYAFPYKHDQNIFRVLVYNRFTNRSENIYFNFKTSTSICGRFYR